jgi:SAM-dependent methyltransferase
MGDQPVRQLFKLYRAAGYGAVSMRLRWLLFPYQKMERLMPPAGLIADVGCGEGMFANLLALTSAARRVIGIDISERRLDLAQLTVQGRGNIEFHRVDARRLRLERLNAAILSAVLHHIPYEDQEPLLQSMWEALASPGILLVLECAKDDGWRCRLSHLYDRLLYPGEKSYFRDAADLMALLTEVGFHVKRQRGPLYLPGSMHLFLCRKP